MKQSFFFLLPAFLLLACQPSASTLPSSDAQSSADEQSQPIEAPAPTLVGDSTLTLPAQRYAALVDDKASLKTLAKVDSLVQADMMDIRQRAQVVYYPFSGPDFLYPYTLFPDADTYVMLGLEKTGSPILDDCEADSVTNHKDVAKAYANALRVYLNSSFFRTNSMRNDLSSTTIDGTIPVISMLMAKSDCQIISITYKQLGDDGTMTDSEKKSSWVEIRFFRNSTPQHEQTLYYFSCNAADSGLPARLHQYLNRSLEGRQVVTFLKAASYLMHKSYFSKIRNTILHHSFAVLQDDSGIPYRFFASDWDVTLYGTYKRPLRLFAEMTYQEDLDSLYMGPDVRPLDFRIGYNKPSNWMCSRKK